MEDVVNNYNSIMEQIRISADQADRDLDDIKLIVVTKKFNSEKIKPLLDIGHLYYGENRVQEALDKWPDLLNNYKDINLSLIGPLQTNKVKTALDLFSSIHTIDRKKLVDKIKSYPEKLKKINELFIQVNLGDESQKAGISMCLPPKKDDASIYFAFLNQMATQKNLNKLSMGMSSDFKDAILFGATHIRVGEAIMGNRGE